MINEKAKENILQAIVKEKEAAVSNYGYFHSDHEFWAVLHEEIEELKEYSNFLLTKETILWSFTRENYVLESDVLETTKEVAINAACEAVQVAAVIDKYLEGRKL